MDLTNALGERIQGTCLNGSQGLEVPTSRYTTSANLRNHLINFSWVDRGERKSLQSGVFG